MMQSAVSVSFLKPKYTDFLYAVIGEQQNEMPISVLSALTRLDVDPWLEAEALSGMPREGALQRLATLVARLPGRQSSEEDCEAIAERLIKLLPRTKQSNTRVQNNATTRPWVPRPLSWRQVLYLAIAIGFLVLAATIQFETLAGLSTGDDQLYPQRPTEQTFLPGRH